MPKAIFEDVIQYLRRVSAVRHAKDLTDAELLRRFVDLREDAAFTVLVQRHGPMVLSVCRHGVGDGHAAEDAFQATFLVLVRRAASIRLKGSLGAWLYAVAQRIALRARGQTAARRCREKRFDPMPCAEPLDELMARELRSVLDEEIGRLPEKYRAPIVLCYFEGKSHDQAARELGWAKKSLTNRLGCGREMLRLQLVKRGITLSAAALATALCKQASASPVAAMLTINTVKAAASFAAGQAVAGGCLSPQAVVLAEAALRGVIGLKMKWIAIALALSVALGCAGIAGHRVYTSRAMAPPARPGRPVQADQQRAPIEAEELPLGALRKVIWPAFRHADFVAGITVTKDNKHIVTGSWAGAFVWELATGKLVKTFPHCSYGLALTASNDLLALFDSEQVVVIEFSTGKQRFAVKLKSQDLDHAFAFSPDGMTLAVAMGKTIRFWNTATGEEAGTLTGHQETVNVVVYHPDGRTLFSASDDCTVRQWDLVTGQPIREFVDGNQWRPHAITVSENSKTLGITACGKESIHFRGSLCVRLLDVATFKERFSAVVPGAVRGLDVVLSENGRYVGATFDGWRADYIKEWRMQLWDSWTCKEIAITPDNKSLPFALCFLDSGKTLATGGGDGVVRLWDVADGRESPLTKGPAGPVEVLGFSPSGKAMASRSTGSQVHLWDTATGSPLFAFVNETSINTAQFSPDGTQILCSSAERGRGAVANLWNVVIGKKVRTFLQEGGCAAMAPDGKMVAAADYEHNVCLLDVATGSELGRLVGHTERVHAVAFSPGGDVLATASADKTLRLWNIASRSSSAKIADAKIDRCARIWYSPDGSFLFVWERSELGPFVGGGPNHAIHVFEAFTGESLFHQKSKLSEISGFRFTGGGMIMDFAAPSGKFGSIDLVAGRVLDSDVKHGGEFKHAVFSLDGKTLALGYKDGRLLLWPPPPVQRQELLPITVNELQLRQAWQSLAASDAKAALQARWLLSAAAKQTLALLRKELRPAKGAGAKQIAVWIEQLDSSSFKEREQAMLSLENRDNGAEAALCQVLKAMPPLEVRRRVELLLGKLTAPPSGELLRALRAVVILENIDGDGATAILRQLASGASGAPVTVAAKGALSRVK